MKRLLLDVDGVIADFFKATELDMASMGLKPARQWTEWDILKMDWIGLDDSPSDEVVREISKHALSYIWNKKGFCLSIPEFNGAVEEVKRLAEVFDVYFVTSPMVTNKRWVWERSQWLTDRFGPELGKKVVHTHYKELVAGSALIDDKPQHVVDWHYEHGTIETFEGVLNRPYNQGTEGARRYDSLLELLTYA